MELILVGIGGALGSLSRFIAGRAISARSKTAFPAGTFLINIAGSLLLGVLVSVQITNSRPYLFFGDGFLGAFTTFSTFLYEGFQLLEDREWTQAFQYIAGSLTFGILAFVAGFQIGGLF